MALDFTKWLVPPLTPITVAGTVVGDSPIFLPPQDEAEVLGLQANFAWGSGGTTCKVYVQTSLDGGVTWFDIVCFAFTTAIAQKVAQINVYAAVAVVTPTDATLADNTLVSGLLGDRIRAKRVVAGTYATTTLGVSVHVR